MHSTTREYQWSCWIKLCKWQNCSCNSSVPPLVSHYLHQCPNLLTHFSNSGLYGIHRMRGYRAISDTAAVCLVASDTSKMMLMVMGKYMLWVCSKTVLDILSHHKIVSWYHMVFKTSWEVWITCWEGQVHSNHFGLRGDLSSLNYLQKIHLFKFYFYKMTKNELQVCFCYEDITNWTFIS